MTPREVIIAKFTSGKFWLTIITGIVFAFAVWKRILNPESTATIITMVFVSYFSKKNEAGGEQK